MVRRLIDEAVAKHDVEVLDELAAGEFARIAKRWLGPFQSAFPDFEMEIVELIAEGDTVVAHFRCSGTHRGEWIGVPATGRRFENVDEIYIFRVRDGKLISGDRCRRQSEPAAPTRQYSKGGLSRREFRSRRGARPNAGTVGCPCVGQRRGARARRR